jgi:orsellinic acid C2-O-methyltransferase
MPCVRPGSTRPCRNGPRRSPPASQAPTTSPRCASSPISGGGQGTLLAAVLQRHRHLRGILFDVADVTHRAGRVLREAGVAERCEIIAGDFFVGVPEGADGYLLANVLHDWDDRLAAQILRVCRRTMRPGARVLIIERLIAANPPDSVPVLLSDLNMLLLSGGQERTNAEYGALLAAAGLRTGPIQPVAPPYGVIEGLQDAEPGDLQRPPTPRPEALPAR